MRLHTWQHKATVGTLTLSLLLVAACRKEPTPPSAGDRASETRKTDASRPVADEPEDRPSDPPDEDAADPAEPPTRPTPQGKPSPTAVTGHAVSFAGWLPAQQGVQDQIALCDPGDNALQGEVLHRWEDTPRKIPVHYGQRRPTVVLLPAGPFTVTGAVVVTKRSAAEPPRPLQVPQLVSGMPDLSQDFQRKWVGLCGPTSAANLLFAMGHTDDSVLPGYRRGPSREADEGVIRLIVGDAARINPTSLAGRMSSPDSGDGVSSSNIQEGLTSWLDDHAPEDYSVALDWFDDTVKPPEEQRKFFARLAQASELGGGAVLCLWPGSEFADGSVADSEEDPATEAAASTAAADPLPPAEFPTPATTEPSPPTFPARDTGDTSPEKAASSCRALLTTARRSLRSGNHAAAFRDASRAVACIRNGGGGGDEARELEMEAAALCEEIARKLPHASSSELEKKTEFK